MTSSGDLNWRLTVRFESHTHAHRIFSALKTHAAAALAAKGVEDGIVAQHEGEWLRLYALSEDALHRGQAIVAAALETEGVAAEEKAEHRASESAEWEPIELPPPPEQDAPLVDEHRGRGPWGSEADPDRVQAHFELHDRHAAQTFASELERDGYDVHHVGTRVFIFADDGASARELGNSLRERAPAGAQLFLEGEARTYFI